MRLPHPLSHQSLSLDHGTLVSTLATQDQLLIIQDLDGVCMGLVNDPRQRRLDPDYVRAIAAFDRHFFVLTNGEHCGGCGVNLLVERAGLSAPFYLPGLAAGGIQWQDRNGQVSHPGVSDAELDFLAQVPQRMGTHLHQFFASLPPVAAHATLESILQATVLDNQVSPTLNLNQLYRLLQSQPAIYRDLQQAMEALMTDLMGEAERQGLRESFFVHYAPNLGIDADGNERIQWGNNNHSGTTDFQFMLRGGRKEAGVLVLLNHYYGIHFGVYPLGPNFHVRNAPGSFDALLALVTEKFDCDRLPFLVGVGDTVTSQGIEQAGELVFRRGGSDRGFLHLIQEIGRLGGQGHLTVYVDSSGGEVKNRKPLVVADTPPQGLQVLEGPTDPRDFADPLKLNVAIPGGHRDYIRLLMTAARLRQEHAIA
jgi:glucosylglycerol 3-phosphatase